MHLRLRTGRLQRRGSRLDNHGTLRSAVLRRSKSNSATSTLDRAEIVDQEAHPQDNQGHSIAKQLVDLETKNQTPPWVTNSITLNPSPLWAPLTTKIFHGLQTAIAKGRPREQQLRGALDEGVTKGGNYRPQPNSIKVCDPAAFPVVKGSIPKELNGLYMRNGSNFAFDPHASAHVFEGDGMIHAVQIQDGKVTSYSNDYVITSFLLQQKRANQPLFGKFGDMTGPRGLAVALLEDLKGKTGVLDLSQGKGTANTSIIHHAGKLLALHEGDWPYEIALSSDGGIETVGRVTIPGWPLGMPFTAHPKKDPSTGHLHFFGSQLERAPYLQYGCLDDTGRLVKSFPINVDYPTMAHDMALTENYAIFLHLPLCFTPELMAKTEDGMPIGWVPEKPSRIGVLRLDAASDEGLVWFEISPAFMAFHTAAAFEEEDGSIRLFACCAEKGFKLSATEFSEDIASRMCEIKLDLKTRMASGPRRLSDDTGEFPVSNPDLMGRKCKYAFMPINSVDDPIGRMTGIAKYDLLSGSVVGRVSFGPERSGGEATFVPRERDPSKRGGSDVGWLLCYVYDEREDVSFLQIFDAVTLRLEAEVRMPHRIPSGFHTCFVRRECL